jgi:hypothetical protein
MLSDLEMLASVEATGVRYIRIVSVAGSVNLVPQRDTGMLRPPRGLR